MAPELLSSHRCFGGTQAFYRHESRETSGAMRFSVFTPPQAAHGKVPVLFYLAGLTCTEETFAIKAGAQRVAAELGLMLVAPDTSPRDTGIAGATGDWEFGEGAGFYLDATEAPWRERFRMESYVVHELPALIGEHFPAELSRCGLFGHSMGGHGALVLALRNPGRYRSLSAFAPIGAPSQCPWGEKAFSRYLGDEREQWLAHDASALLAHRRFPGRILIDQGTDDKFIHEQLRPETLEHAAIAHGQALELRRHAGYDHGYYFIASLMEDHLRHHAENLV
ncbi:S-formylglutathione hydrolase [Niveibacterium sp.]|uniref:S-formylglutathione hydrolase n=1 Tax=Niveibacterium sp. TaxID=2017444 RepID=UPI0035AF8F1F